MKQYIKPRLKHKHCVLNKNTKYMQARIWLYELLWTFACTQCESTVDSLNQATKLLNWIFDSITRLSTKYTMSFRSHPPVVLNCCARLIATKHGWCIYAWFRIQHCMQCYMYFEWTVATYIVYNSGKKSIFWWYHTIVCMYYKYRIYTYISTP